MFSTALNAVRCVNGMYGGHQGIRLLGPATADSGHISAQQPGHEAFSRALLRELANPKLSFP